MTTTLEPPDSAATAPEPPRGGVLAGRFRAPTIGIVMLVTLLAFEAMAVGTAMPVVARDLNGLALYAWGFSATLIASLLATVLSGGWVDRSGPARPLLAGLVTFVAGLLASGLAPTMWLFVAGRAVQGIGSGLSMVALYVVIARVYPETLRPRVFAALSAAWVLPSLIGPAVGGAIAEHAGWRWVFLGLIPLVVPAAALLVPAMRDLRAAGRATPTSPVRYLAAVTLAAGAGALLYVLDHPTWVLVPVAAAAVAGLAFGLTRLLPAGTARLGRGLPSIVATRGMLSGAFFGMDVFIPLALTRMHHFSPTQAGVTLTVGALGWSVASQVQGRSRRSRAFFVRLGAVLVTAGIVGVTLALQVNGWAAAPAWILGGAGMGFAISSLSVLTLDQSAEQEQGANSSALQISDTLGSSLVVGVAGALVTGLGTDRLELGLVVAGALFAAIAALGIVAALRLETRP
ncbi:MFS transporter [Actinomadura kijaniata]|uniref:MFS transporter n=1 Tax=Actinomadura kijaniata TaxID=46161 RepID=UPI00082AA74F|nr:MFS transporter [Actinomadura kijaniata]